MINIYWSKTKNQKIIIPVENISYIYEKDNKLFLRLKDSSVVELDNTFDDILKSFKNKCNEC